MKSFALLSVVVCVLAQSDSCPSGLAPQQGSAGISFCCPSGMTVNDPTGTYCILGCQKGYLPCHPFCSDPNDQTTSGICTSVPVTASNYSQLVGLATASNAAPTDSAGTQTGTTSATGVTQTGSTSSSATATTTSSSSRNAGAVMTAAPLLIAGAFVGVVIV